MPKRQGTSAVRGGRHQRRKAEAAAAAQLEECHAIASIDGLSPIVFKLIEHWAWGGSSALEVCDLARAVTNTFSSVPADVQALAGCGSHGHQPSNSQRDLLRLPALQNLQSPEPFHVTAWVILNPGTRPVLSQEEIAVFLPHDWGSCLSRHGLLDQTVGSLKDAAGFWQEVLPDDPKLFGMDPIFSSTEISSCHLLFMLTKALTQSRIHYIQSPSTALLHRQGNLALKRAVSY